MSFSLALNNSELTEILVHKMDSLQTKLYLNIV